MNITLNPISKRGLLKNGNPPGNPNSAPRCGAQTRKGTPCMAPAVRGKRRCRMHGGKNPGRPPIREVQIRNYSKAVRIYLKKYCSDCSAINTRCHKIHSGAQTVKAFQDRIAKYCSVYKGTAKDEKGMLSIVSTDF